MRITRKNNSRKNKKSFTKKNNKNMKNNSRKNKKNTSRKNKKNMKNKRGGGVDKEEQLRDRVKELKNELQMEKTMNARIKRDLDQIIPSMKELREKIVYQYNAFNDLNVVVGKIFGKKEI